MRMWGAEASGGYGPQERPLSVTFPEPAEEVSAPHSPKSRARSRSPGWGGGLCPPPTQLVFFAQLWDSLKTERGDAQGPCARELSEEDVGRVEDGLYAGAVLVLKLEVIHHVWEHGPGGGAAELSPDPPG